MFPKQIKLLLATGLILILLTACTGAKETSRPPVPTNTSPPASAHDNDANDQTNSEDKDSEDHDAADTDSEEFTEESTPAPMSIDGALLFKENGCADCHGEDRSGVFAPALLPDTLTKSADVYINTITFGSGRMPVFGDDLTQEEITALVDWLQTTK